MTRNTNVKSVLFPVGFSDVVVEGRPVAGHRAIVDQERGRVFAVVSRDYRLVTNEEALAAGRRCFRRLLGIEKEPDNLKVFNILMPESRAHCRIDLIREGDKILFGAEEYLAFLRVTNSYNKTRALGFDLGFCRSICENGVIFGGEAVHFTFVHTNDAVGQEIEFRVRGDKFTRLREVFISTCKGLTTYPVKRGKAVALMARALEVKFGLSRKGKALERAREKRDEFRKCGEKLIWKYFDELGENAYAVFNACTDYASNPGEGQSRHLIDTYQRRIGKWATSFSDQAGAGNFDLDKHIGKYAGYFAVGAA